MSDADNDQLLRRAQEWMNGDPDPQMRVQLESLVAKADWDAIRDHVDGALEFGTAGLRGIVGPGPRRMNRAVVIRTTAGLASWVAAQGPDAVEAGVVVGFDARYDSAQFAADTVGVLAAAGITVYWFPTPQPTPLVAYAQKALGAAAAVVVTASHNPPEYNGYKVYAEGAAQIVPPVDHDIAKAIDAAAPANMIPRADIDDARVHVLGGEIIDRYLAELATARPAAAGPQVRIVYTPLHGVGGELVQRALAEAGYTDVSVVESQATPDPAFSTVAFPNPEEPGAMDAAEHLAREIAADVVLANDPDADRLAVALPRGDSVELLSGNQIGVLLADYLLRTVDVDRPLVVASIVSTPMIVDIARHYGARAEFSLTGFKWVCAAARVLEAERGYRFVYGFEEALGSSVGTVVRDKDGIGAAVVFADLVRTLAAAGATVWDRLHELAVRDGLWVSHQLSITRPGLAGQREIADAMQAVGDSQPDQLAGHAVVGATDYRVGADGRPAWLAAHDLVAFELADGRVMIRPSGTEPKCKIYVDLRAEFGPDDDLAVHSRRLERDAANVAQALASFVGFE